MTYMLKFYHAAIPCHTQFDSILSILLVTIATADFFFVYDDEVRGRERKKEIYSLLEK